MPERSDLPSVSIGIPTWNRAQLVCHAIHSVLDQDYRGHIEIVVADDGSTDDTLEVLKEQFGDRMLDQTMVVLPDRHLGIAATKNRALKGSTGELRGILDSDDFYQPEFVSTCVEALLAHPEGLVYTDNYYVNDSGDRKLEPSLDWSFQGLLETCNLRSDCWLAWWKILERTNLHDERFAFEEDYDLFYQVAQFTEFRRIPLPLQNVRWHSGRMTGDLIAAAYWHAACLAKYGLSIEYARQRAERNAAEESWSKAIEDGYQFGQSISVLPIVQHV